MNFQNDGYQKVPNIFDDETIKAVLNALDVVKPNDSDCFLEVRNNKPKQIQNLHLYDSYFTELFWSKVFPALIKQVGLEGQTFSLVNVALFQKWNGQSGPTMAHQDDHYFQRDMKKGYAVVCWVALDEATKKNGCLRYMPGSHTSPLYKHDDNENGKIRVRTGVKGYAGYLSNINVMDLTPVPASSGDMIVHSNRTIHGAGPNNSDHLRRALTFTVFVDYD